MKKQLVISFMLVLFAFSLLLVGFTSAIEPIYPLDQETVITGMVEQEGDIFFLQAIDGNEYTITGQELSDMVGKKVQATGELVIEKNKNQLNANEIVEVEEESIEQYMEPETKMLLE